MTKLIRTKDTPPFITHTSTIRKRLGKDTGRFGLMHFGIYEYGAQNEIGLAHTGVYQMRKCSEGIIPVKMRFQITREETPTAPRVANWTKFATGVAAWQALTTEQKSVYNERAKSLLMFGFNLFMREYMLSH